MFTSLVFKEFCSATILEDNLAVPTKLIMVLKYNPAIVFLGI